MAILITLEYILENLTNIPCRLLTIFSNSQSTFGLLTLNWKDTRDVTKDIRKTINHVQQSDIAVEINWTPGHSYIAGKDVAVEKLKRRLWTRASSQKKKRTTSHPEIKLACKQYTSTQWQRRWEQSDTGRDFFNYYPKVERFPLGIGYVILLWHSLSLPYNYFSKDSSTK